MNINAWRNLLTLVCFVAFAHSSETSAKADALYSGSIEGSFSDPLLSGYFVNLAGDLVFRDSTAIAVYSIPSSGSVAQITFGDNLNGAGASSVITFFGNTFTGVAPEEEFLLGTITYSNGSSNSGTGIYGATLTIAVPNDSSIIPIVAPFKVLTTANGGISAFLDADYLEFGAPLNIRFHVYEGAAGTANVFGKIVGDPVLTLTEFALPQGQAGNAVLTSVPLPGTLPMLCLGLLSFRVARRGLRPM